MSTVKHLKVEDTSMIYYINKEGIVQDGNQWIDDYKHGDITSPEFEDLEECFWSALAQKWVRETKKK